MTGHTNAKLFVNLAASKARRRLKGFFNGVGKMETVSNNKAVIIYTAARQHLRQLEKWFADMGYSKTEVGLGMPTHFWEVLIFPDANH